MKLTKTLWKLMIISTIAFVVGCSDGSDTTDGDSEIDGDTPVVDGDEVDGDSPVVDGDQVDGDQADGDYEEIDASYTLLNATGGKRVFLDIDTGKAVNESDDWHIAYEKYVGFSLNGGVSGDGELSGCTGKAYPELYDNEDSPVPNAFDDISAESTSQDFAKLDSNSCSDFLTDTIKPMIEQSQWLTAEFGPSGPTFAPNQEDTNGFIIRSAETNNDKHEYARVRVAEINYESGETTIRQIKFATEKWNHSNQSFDTESLSDWLDFSSTPAYWDLETNQSVTADDEWELSIQVAGRDWNILVNSGVSGSGMAGVGLINLESGVAVDVTDPTDTEQVYRYFSDSVSGALAGPGNFGPLEYDVHGIHGMSPNFTHYLIKDGDRLFKLQVLSNYGKENDKPSGIIYIRFGEF